MLKILGIVFLVIIGVVVTFAIWLGIRVRQGMQQQERLAAIEEGMNVPEIILEPTDHPALAHPDVVSGLVAQAEQAGATHCGTYDAPAAGVRLYACAFESPPVYAVIYDHDQVEPWMDVVLRMEGDRSFTASTAPEIGRGAPRPPEDEIVFFAPGTDLGALVRAAAERAKDEAVLPAVPGEFKANFEAAAEKSQKYIQTQTVSQDWLEEIAQDAGVELTGEEAGHINFSREAQQVTEITNGCLKSLAETGKYTAAEWDDLRDRLVVVWDDMPGAYVSSMFYEFVDLPQELEDAVDELEDETGSARERVAKLNAKLPEELRLTPEGAVASPVAADIYRGRVPIV